jgi:hypothetical protein
MSFGRHQAVSPQGRVAVQERDCVFVLVDLVVVIAGLAAKQRADGAWSLTRPARVQADVKCHPRLRRIVHRATTSDRRAARMGQ